MIGIAISTSAPLRYVGPFTDIEPSVLSMLLARGIPADDDARGATAAIIADVRAHGDRALLAMAQRYDGVSLDSLEVPRAVMDDALRSLDDSLRRALERAARNIATVHRAMQPVAMEVESEPGVIVGRRPDPLARIGVYAPGGRASYPSSVLMGAIPARVAGVREVILCSPPARDGMPAAATLAAAVIAGVDRAFAIGGAGAIAAMAMGTATVPRVDRVVGPGNAYVAEAKRQLVGDVAIDSPAGPSELLVIADDTADPALVAMEMIAQAEHDPRACVVAAVIGGDAQASALAAALERAAAATARRDIVSAALAGQGAILTFDDVAGALAFAASYAPEHLLLAVDRAIDLLPRVRNAGTVFVGATSSVAFGDYLTGANHVLPTAGAARMYSGLSPLDFVRWTTYQRVDAPAAARLAVDTACLADAEGLPAHAATARRWSVAT
jgi:histidinol dehydrogenase